MAKQTIKYAGDFELEKAELLTSGGISIDLLNLVAEITIEESLFRPVVYGTITFVDTQNLVINGPIIGQEHLKLTISTPGFNDDMKIKFDEQVFHTQKILLNEDTSNGARLVSLSFVTKEMFMNQRVRVSRSIEGNFSTIVRSVCEQELESTKELFLEDSLNVKKLVIPRMKPFDVINMAKQQAISSRDNNASFLFYETRRGFHFRTLESLYEQTPLQEYFVNDPDLTMIERQSGEDIITMDYKRIRDFNIIPTRNILESTDAGALGGNIIIHDSFNKTYSEYSYNYFDSFSAYSHIGDYGEKSFPIYSATRDNEGRRISDFKESVNFFVSTSIKDIDTATSAIHETNGRYPFKSVETQNWLFDRNNRIQNLTNGLVVNLMVAGVTGAEVGDTININMPVTGLKNSKNEDLDDTYKGKFLVQNLKHVFTTTDRMHNMLMSVAKDSVPVGFTATGKTN